MESVGGEVGRNVDLGLRLLDQAAASGAEVALLPEYWSTGFFPASRDYRRYDLAAADDGPADDGDPRQGGRAGHARGGDHLRARRQRPLLRHRHAGRTGRAHRRQVSQDPHRRRAPHRRGRRAGHRPGHRVHLLPHRHALPVFGIGEWRVGIMLCYDTYFPEAARCLALAGAEVILAPFGISDTKKTIGRSCWRRARSRTSSTWPRPTTSATCRRRTCRS